MRHNVPAMAVIHRKRSSVLRGAARALLACAALCVAGALPAQTPAGAFIPAKATPLPYVTRVVVHKAQRRLELMQGSQVVRSYKVALGLMPEGHKERAGDFRTPEGSYAL